MTKIYIVREDVGPLRTTWWLDHAAFTTWKKADNFIKTSKKIKHVSLTEIYEIEVAS